jgi:hypothetical protein
MKARRVLLVGPMSRFALAVVPLVALALGACAVDNTQTMDAYAPAERFHTEIRACLDHRICEQLCMNVFELRYDEFDSCRIISHDDAGAMVRVHLYGGDELGFDDGTGGGDCWDCDDGYEDDGGTVDDPPPPDDGSGTEDPPPDDGGGSGSDDGSGDPTPRHVLPSHRA